MVAAARGYKRGLVALAPIHRDSREYVERGDVTMGANSVPSLSDMKHVRVTMTLTTVYMWIAVDITGPGNLVDLVLAGVKTAAAKWPAAITVTKH